MLTVNIKLPMYFTIGKNYIDNVTAQLFCHEMSKQIFPNEMSHFINDKN